MVVTTTSMFPIILFVSASVSAVCFSTVMHVGNISPSEHTRMSVMSTYASKDGMKLFLLFIFTVLVAEAAKQKSGDVYYDSAVLSLKGKDIPSNGSGVIIFDDIGGYLGLEDGLICTANFSECDFAERYWSYPNGTLITQRPSLNVFGTDTCHIEQGVSLYYSGQPKEKGLFQCTLNVSSPLSVHTASVYIVDMNVTGTTLDWPSEVAIAGENVEISMSVTTLPENVSVPYQWMLNGTSLPSNHTKYQGTQNSTLTIFNVQDLDQGNYTCSVAHSASGTRVNSTTLRVVTLGVKVDGSTNNPEIGKNYTLTCTHTGVDVIKNLNPEYQFLFLQGGKLFHNAGSTPFYYFDSLKFSDADIYACKVIATFKRGQTFATTNGTSSQLSLTFSAIVYRIYLQIKLECRQWTDRDTNTMKQRLIDINKQISDGIMAKCSQIVDVPITNNNHAFKCPDSPKNMVVYNAQLQCTDQVNTSLLVSCLDKWITTKRNIIVNGVELSIDHDCTKVVNDNNHDYECAASGNHLTRSDKLAIGFGSASVGLGVALIFAVIGIICMIRNRHRIGYQQPNHP